jgi:hypothetical protein
MPGYNQSVIKAAVAKMLRAAAEDLEKTKGSGRTYNAAIEWPTLITIENEEGGPAALRAVADLLDSTEPVVPLSEVKEALLEELQRRVVINVNNAEVIGLPEAKQAVDAAFSSTDSEGQGR